MKALLVNYEYCTGCHSCEVACKKYLGLPKGEFGIKLLEIKPYMYDANERGNKRWEWTYNPTPTKACNMCKDRTEIGKMPMCVQHCQAWCMFYGEAEDMLKKIDGTSRFALYTIADE